MRRGRSGAPETWLGRALSALTRGWLSARAGARPARTGSLAAIVASPLAAALVLVPAMVAGVAPPAADRAGPDTAAAGQTARRQIVTRRFTARDQQVGRYQYVPFDVPDETTSVVVGYRYDRRDGANVVDLGLFEPGPLTLGSPSFRGWSGGGRDTVTIALDHATPGYWPGPIPPGRWHVMLGLYKVAPEGVDVEITVETSVDPRPAAPLGLPPRPREPLRRGAAWYAGALHAHTVHSDGALTLQELAGRARHERLDFLAVTDHNNTVHQLEAFDAPDLLLIAGEEVTTPGGHFNVWGLAGERAYVDFRVAAGDPAIQSLAAGAREGGALVSINHPFASCFGCPWTHPVPEVLDAIEISDERPEARLQAMAMWDLLLRQGRRVAAVATSDWHRGAAPLGVPAVRVFAPELSTPAILAGIREGRVVVVADASLPAPVVSVRAGETVAFTGGLVRAKPGEALQVGVQGAPEYDGARVDLLWNGEVVASGVLPAGGEMRFERHATAPGYLRVHLFAAGGTLLALTNPIFVEVAQP